MSAWNELLGHRLAAKQELAFLGAAHNQQEATISLEDHPIASCNWCDYKGTDYAPGQTRCPRVQRAVEACLALGCTWPEMRMVWEQLENGPL